MSVSLPASYDGWNAGVWQHEKPLFDTLEEGEHRKASSSYSTLLTTLLPLLIISAPLVLSFLYLRVKFRRVYAPRTFLDTLHDEEKTPKLEKNGFLNWVPEFWNRPDDEILNHQNMDGFLFVRFLRTITVISFTGFCLTLPVMLLNYKGGGKKSELASLTFSNVTNPTWYYFHLLVATIFFVYVMYTITKETIYYINLRYAFYLTPRNATRISSRTVLFTSVPEDWRNEEWLRAEFDQIETIWIATDCKNLKTLVKKRDSIAFKLEEAEVQLSSTAVLKRAEEDSLRPSRREHISSGVVGSQDRPKTRSIPLIGRKSDIIESSRNILRGLVPKSKNEQERHLAGDAKTSPAVFIQFKTQRAAQAAFQIKRNEQPGRMEPRSINTLPDEIIWDNLGMARWSRIARAYLSHIIIVFLIIFWSIPVGVIGALANIDALVDQLPFLGFVNKIPDGAVGALSSLPPAILISALLAIVPIICRFFATKSGAVTLAQVELQTQSWYFGFQVVQVFLITTFSSGASAVAKQILDDPTQAPSLLAENLPQASNFYLSYFMLQGLTVAASEIFQPLPLLMFSVASRFLDKTPRAKYNRWTSLSDIRWGNTYPKLTNLAVIALAYSCIAPLTLVFAAAGLGLLYLAFRYNIFYAVSTAVDTKGDAYGRALQHLTTGIYLAELCLIGLFAANGGRGPSQLMILFFVLTIIYQAYLNWVLSPLLNSLSDKLLKEDEEEALHDARLEDGQPSPSNPSLSTLINDNLGTIHGRRASKLVQHRDKGGYFAPYLFHGSKSSYPELRTQLASAFPGKPAPKIPEEARAEAYLHPAITSPVPKLWFANDGLGVSKAQIAELRPLVEAVDEGASIDAKGRVVWDQDNLKDAPVWKDRIDL